MSKVLLVGDMHEKEHIILPNVSSVIKSHDINRVIFLGDYIDEWESTERNAIDCMKYLLDWYTKHKESVEIEMLYGNHDMAYTHKFICSGHRSYLEDKLNEYFNKLPLKVATSVDGFICTHAGLTKDWVLKYLPDSDSSNIDGIVNSINRMLDTYSGIQAIYSVGQYRGGRDIPGPLWADTRELVADPYDVKQIVGHTPVGSVTRVDRDAYSMKETYAIDTFSLTMTGTAIGNGSMLEIDEGSNENTNIVGFPGYKRNALNWFLGIDWNR